MVNVHFPKPGIRQVQALAHILHSALCCHSNETRAPIAYLPNSAQLEGTSTIHVCYIRVRAVMWEYGEGQTHRPINQYTFRVVYNSCEM